MTPEAFARDVAAAWAQHQPKHKPVADLAYMADKAYWQACNMYGFKGDLVAWTKLVEASLPSGRAVPLPAPAPAPAPVPVPVQEVPRQVTFASLGDLLL